MKPLVNPPRELAAREGPFLYFEKDAIDWPKAHRDYGG